jgi:hypothetical protein
MERRTQAAAYAVRAFGDHHDDKRGDTHVGPGVYDVPRPADQLTHADGVDLHPALSGHVQI